MAVRRPWDPAAGFPHLWQAVWVVSQKGYFDGIAVAGNGNGPADEHVAVVD